MTLAANIFRGVPVSLNIRSRRIRSCREDAMGSRIAKRLVPDLLVPCPE